MSTQTPGQRVSLADAAERLGIHYMTAYRYVHTGRLEARKEGGTWVVDLRDLADFDRRGRTARPRRSADFLTEFEDRLLQADEHGAWNVVERAINAGTPPPRVLVDVVGPALASIGDRWARGETTVGREHLASATATRIISRLSPRLAYRGQVRGHVVIGAAPHDTHALPSAIVRDLLRNRGIAVTDLGANVPVGDWADIVRAAAGDGDPPLIAAGICSTTSGHHQQVEAAVLAIRATCDVPIVVGGLGITADTATRLGADAYSRSTIEAIALFDDLTDAGS